MSTRSAASSVSSYAGSVLSRATGSTSATSIAGPEGASERLTSLVFESPSIKPLCFQAVKIMPVERLERNLRRLLKLFSKDLLQEASTPADQRAARFVRTLVRNSAHLICDELNVEKNTDKDIEMKNTTADTIEDEEVSDNSDLERGDDDDSDFREFEIFILRSHAFRDLEANLQDFVHPAKDIAALGKAPRAPPTLIVEGGKGLQSDLDAIGSNTLPENQLRMLSSYLVNVKNFLGGKPLQSNMSRVEWTCACGTTAYDDYEELVPGAAKAFERELKGSPSQCVPQQLLGPAEGDRNNAQPFKLILSTTRLAFSGLFQKLKLAQARDIPQYELRPDQGARVAQSSQSDFEALYLLICMNDSVGASVVRLQQLSVHDIDSDRKLFDVLRGIHASLRQRWWSFLSLWTLQQINFVQFDVYEKFLVDIRELDVVPPADQFATYRHEPTHLKPPIGSNMLMHYMRCPQDATTRAPCLTKFPKKIREKLTVCPIKGVSPGWGLQFVEGWDWKKILIGSFLAFLISATIVGIVCWRLGHNIQDTFAVAGSLLTCFGLGIAALQAYLNMA